MSRVLDENNHPINVLLDFINLGLSLLVIIHYIIFTYNEYFWHNKNWGLINFVIHLYFFSEYFVRIYASKD